MAKRKRLRKRKAVKPPAVEGLLHCGGCGRMLPKTEFWKNKREARGYQYECKECFRVRSKERREKKREQAKQEGKENPLLIQERARRKKKRMETYAQKISSGEPLGPQSMVTKGLIELIEQQLRLSYENKLHTDLGRLRFDKHVQGALYEIKDAVRRFRTRASRLVEEDSVPVMRGPSLEDLQKRAEARRLLEVPAAVSTENLKKAYLLKAKEFHPDRCGDTEQMQKINEAYTLLKESMDG